MITSYSHHTYPKIESCLGSRILTFFFALLQQGTVLDQPHTLTVVMTIALVFFFSSNVFVDGTLKRSQQDFSKKASRTFPYAASNLLTDIHCVLFKMEPVVNVLFLFDQR